MSDNAADKAEVELTEMVDIKATRYDGVKSAASGYPILMLKSVEPPATDPAPEPEPPAAKAAEPVADPPAEDKTSGDEPVKEDGISKELQERFDALEKAKTEADKASEQRIAALEAQLAKVLDTPIPGGPAITAPQTARKAREAESRLVEAARYRRLAEDTTDADLKKFYKERAHQLGEEDIT